VNCLQNYADTDYSVNPAEAHVRQLNEFDTGTGSVYIALKAYTALKARDISAKGSAMILYAHLGAERSPPALRRWKQGLKTTHCWSKAPGYAVVKPVHHRHKAVGSVDAWRPFRTLQKLDRFVN